MPKCDKTPCKMEGEHGQMQQIPCKMQSDHAKMYQIPCKMTGSSSKLLQIQGKWYWERKPKTNQNLMQTNPKTILHPFIVDHFLFMIKYIYIYTNSFFFGSVKSSLEAYPALSVKPFFGFKTRQEHPKNQIRSLKPKAVWEWRKGQKHPVDCVMHHIFCGPYLY